MGTRSNNALVIKPTHLRTMSVAALERLSDVAQTIAQNDAHGWIWETNISPFFARHGVVDLKEEVAILEWVLSLPADGFKLYREGEDPGSMGAWDDHPLRSHPQFSKVIADFNDQQQELAVPAADLSQAIVQMVDINTSHIPKHTADALGDRTDKPEEGAFYNVLNYMHHLESGWIIGCSNAYEIDADHPELATLIRLAAANGAHYLKLDADSSIVQGLPTFKW